MMNAAKESAAKENVQPENEDQESYSEEDDEKDQPAQKYETDPHTQNVSQNAQYNQAPQQQKEARAIEEVSTAVVGEPSPV